MNKDGTMSATERRELKAIVKSEFGELREELGLRRQELTQEARKRITDKHKKAVAKAESDLKLKMQRVNETLSMLQAEIDTKVADGFKLTRWSRKVDQINWDLSLSTQAWDDEWNEASRKLDGEYSRAVQQINKEENKVLKDLLLSAIKSDEAKAFLDRIPSAAELLPGPAVKAVGQ